MKLLRLRPSNGNMNSRQLLFCLFIIGSTCCARADLQLADSGKTKFIILTQPGAIPAETNAAQELASTLKQITGVEFPIQSTKGRVPDRAIVIGPGPVAEKLFPEIPFNELGAEEIVIKTKGNHLLLAGGRPRGT